MLLLGAGRQLLCLGALLVRRPRLGLAAGGTSLLLLLVKASCRVRYWSAADDTWGGVWSMWSPARAGGLFCAILGNCLEIGLVLVLDNGEALWGWNVHAVATHAWQPGSPGFTVGDLTFDKGALLLLHGADVAAGLDWVRGHHEGDGADGQKLSRGHGPVPAAYVVRRPLRPFWRPF
eukprot:COSAG01_NODE_14986_length_1388_cov_1.787432_1_plen_177_part_00